MRKVSRTYPGWAAKQPTQRQRAAIGGDVRLELRQIDRQECQEGAALFQKRVAGRRVAPEPCKKIAGLHLSEPAQKGAYAVRRYNDQGACPSLLGERLVEREGRSRAFEKANKIFGQLGNASPGDSGAKGGFPIGGRDRVRGNPCFHLWRKRINMAGRHAAFPNIVQFAQQFCDGGKARAVDAGRQNFKDDGAKRGQAWHEIRQNIHQRRFHRAGMRIQPKTAFGFTAGQVNFPHPIQWNGVTKIRNTLAAIPFVAKRVVQIEQNAAIGGLRDGANKIAIRHFTR